MHRSECPAVTGIYAQIARSGRICCLAWVCLSVGAACVRAQTPRPLAYVRRLVLPPIAMAAPAEPPLPAAPPTPARPAYRRWMRLRAQRDVRERLRRGFLERFGADVRLELARLAGITLTEDPVATSAVEWSAADGDSELAPSPAMRANWSGMRSDGIAAVAIDRFGLEAGFERRVWLRVVAYIVPDGGGPLRGPFHAYALASTTRRLIGRGYGKNDDELTAQASAMAARQLAHILETGVEPPFVRGGRVAILPAFVPDRVLLRKRAAASPETAESDAGMPDTTEIAPAVWIATPLLRRQADVLLQPDVGPIAALIDRDEVEAALHRLRVPIADLWTPEGEPAFSRVLRVARQADADYVFISRLTDIELVERPFMAADLGTPRPGVERTATAEAGAVLLRVSDGAILWRDIRAGMTVARTEYVRHRPRIRSEEQAAVDAVRTAFAYLRFSLEDYRRRYER